MLSPTTLLYILAVLSIFTFLQAMIAILQRGSGAAPGLRRRTLADGLSPWLADILLTRRIADFEALVAGSGTRHPPARVLTGMAVAVLVVTLLWLVAGYDGLHSFAGGIAIGVALPVLVLVRLRNRRLAKLTLQLPDAIDMLVRSLRAGLPTPIGISLVAKEMPEPVSGEFRRVCESMSYGLDLKEALDQFGRRLPIAEVKYLVAAIRVQYATGGSLADVLASLGGVMRERVRFKLKVKALSAESRLSGTIMAFLPFVLIGGMLYIRPDFYKDVPGNPALQTILLGAAILLFVGIVLMRRIVNVRA